MNPDPAQDQRGEFSVLLVGLQPRERQAAAAACGRVAAFLDGPPAALAELSAGRGTVLVCRLESFPALRPGLAAASRQGRPVAVLVLAAAGEEEAAARLLAGGAADVLMCSGGYEKLLAAWLERARPDRVGEVSAAEIGRLIRHEINNPLTGVLGNAELILAGGGPLSDDTRSRLLTIIQLAVRIRDVLRTLEDRLRRRAHDTPGPASRPGSAPARFAGRALP